MDLAGSMNYNTESGDYNVSSNVSARGVEVEQDGIHVRDARITAKMLLNPRGMELSGVVVDALGGRFTGKASLPELRRFTVDGTAQNFPIQQALATFARTFLRREKLPGAARPRVRFTSKAACTAVRSW